MSFALMTYVVDLDVLNGSVGSKDDKLRRMIGGRFRRHLAHFDSEFDRWCHTVVATPQVKGVADGDKADAHPR